MTDLFPDPGTDWKLKLKRLLLDFDARIDSAIFEGGKWAREIYERFTAFMDRCHVAGWRRWLLVEPISEGATLGTGGLLLMLLLALPAFRETSDEDWLKKSDLAVTFLDRYGNEVGNRGIKHNDSVAARGHARPSGQGNSGDRGPALLRAFRHRLLRHRPRADDQCQGRRRGAGRVHHHPAARQEPVPVERAHYRAQDQRSLPRALAGDAALQERNPQALSRPRLSRRRRLRRRRRGAVLFRKIGARRDARRSGDARRPVQGAEQILAARRTCRRRARAPMSCSTIWSTTDS